MTATRVRGKLGKTPARPRARDIAYPAVTAAAGTPPRAPVGFGHYQHIDPHGWGMLGNDMHSNCVFAGADHETMLLALMNGRPVPPFRPEDALSDYAAVTGFDPATGAGDNGTDVHDALNYRRLTGVRDAHAARHQIGAYVALEPGDWGQLLEALCAFDFVAIGFQFPSTADAQFAAGHPWSYVPGATIDGGHYVPVVGRPHVSMVEVLTWGQTQPMTRSFFHHYADECYGIVSVEQLGAGGVTPEGLDLDRLNAILAAL